MGETGATGATGPCCTGETGPTGPSSLPVNNTVFVDAQFGDDSTGVPEDMARPYRTVQAASAAVAALAPFTVFVRPGSYAFNETLVDQIDYYFEQGSLLSDLLLGTPLFEDVSAVRVAIQGYGRFATSSGTSVLQLNDPLSNVQFRADDVTTDGAPAFAILGGTFQAQSDSLVGSALEVSSGTAPVRVNVEIVQLSLVGLGSFAVNALSAPGDSTIDFRAGSIVADSLVASLGASLQGVVDFQAQLVQSGASGSTGSMFLNESVDGTLTANVQSVLLTGDGAVVRTRGGSTDVEFADVVTSGSLLVSDATVSGFGNITQVVGEFGRVAGFSTTAAVFAADGSAATGGGLLLLRLAGESLDAARVATSGPLGSFASCRPVLKWSTVNGVTLEGDVAQSQDGFLFSQCPLGFLEVTQFVVSRRFVGVVDGQVHASGKRWANPSPALVAVSDSAVSVTDSGSLSLTLDELRVTNVAAGVAVIQIASVASGQARMLANIAVVLVTSGASGVAVVRASNAAGLGTQFAGTFAGAVLAFGTSDTIVFDLRDNCGWQIEALAAQTTDGTVLVCSGNSNGNYIGQSMTGRAGVALTDTAGFGGYVRDIQSTADPALSVQSSTSVQLTFNNISTGSGVATVIAGSTGSSGPATIELNGGHISGGSGVADVVLLQGRAHIRGTVTGIHSEGGNGLRVEDVSGGDIFFGTIAVAGLQSGSPLVFHSDSDMKIRGGTIFAEEAAGAAIDVSGNGELQIDFLEILPGRSVNGIHQHGNASMRVTAQEIRHSGMSGSSGSTGDNGAAVVNTSDRDLQLWCQEFVAQDESEGAFFLGGESRTKLWITSLGAANSAGNGHGIVIQDHAHVFAQIGDMSTNRQALQASTNGRVWFHAETAQLGAAVPPTEPVIQFDEITSGPTALTEYTFGGHLRTTGPVVVLYTSLSAAGVPGTSRMLSSILANTGGVFSIASLVPVTVISQYSIATNAEDGATVSLVPLGTLTPNAAVH
ncbi:Hypothetical protein UVM_LOCUS255 [uncultured virus]|nr:Hypothetical protein UVM_LOCUS255 [uncultured virus]